MTPHERAIEALRYGPDLYYDAAPKYAVCLLEKAGLTIVDAAKRMAQEVLFAGGEQ